MIQVTQWFDCDEKPLYKGWYECRYVRPFWPGDDDLVYTFPCKRFWIGFRWALNEKEEATAFGSMDKDQWRGLSEKPLI